MARPMLQPTRLRRAFFASPFVFLSVLGWFVMDIPGMMRLPSPSITGKIEWDGGSVTILRRFHLISFLDEVFRDVTAGFGPAAYGFDEIGRWQMSSFMNDIGVLHIIVMMESFRPANKGTPAYYPAILMGIAQLGGGAVFVPLYYFFHLAFYLPSRSRSAKDQRINLNDAIFSPVLILLFHTVPVVGMFLSPDMQNRHWWIWFWQMYYLRIAIGFYVLRAIRGVVGWPNISDKVNYHRTVLLLVAPAIVLATASWIHIMVEAPFSLHTIFLPAALSPDQANSFVGRIRNILKWDQLICLGGGFLWLTYLICDSRRAKLTPGGFIGGSVLLSLILTAIIGPGGAFGVMWLMRERLLVINEQRSLKKN